MRGRFTWIILSFLMVVSLVLASCATTEEEEEEEGPPVGGEWWDVLGEPEYGGTITFREASIGSVFDPYFPIGGGGMHHYSYEHMFMWDWTLDREIWDFKTGWAPGEYNVGELVESWEWEDSQTLVAQIRQGVHWHDKAPANGRELTADDVVFHYDRTMGTGSGFTEPNPVLSRWGASIDKATVTGDYEVTITFNSPSLFINLTTITDISTLSVIECPEAVQQDVIGEWEYACGTGPYILKDYMPDTSITYERNDNHWAYDERHPDNKLPYVDTIKRVAIPDIATTLASLRTGKVDHVTGVNWEQAQSIKRTNPDIQQASVPGTGAVVNLRCDTEPFTDINVRKALQMSIDRQTIAETHYGGAVDGKPAGLIAPTWHGWTIPYDEWSDELKAEYDYNPERAMEILAEAGYPEGFKTNCYASANHDLDLLQIYKSYFGNIGVDMDIQIIDATAYGDFMALRKMDQMTFHTWVAWPRPPQISVADLLSTGRLNTTLNNDPVYDAFYVELQGSGSVDEAKRIVSEADQYVISHHWGVVCCPTASITVWQPYLKGYMGESTGWTSNWFWARLWVDSDLKASMVD